MYQSNAIVTPVFLEFIGGVRSAAELQLAETYLNQFHVVDNGKVLEEDWQEAERIARRVPRDGTPRQLGDCLIRAIANRLRYDVSTIDQRFPR